MRKLLMMVSLAGLVLTLIPAVLVFTGAIAWETHASLMTVGMVCWFATAPFWMKKSR